KDRLAEMIKTRVLLLLAVALVLGACGPAASPMPEPTLAPMILESPPPLPTATVTAEEVETEGAPIPTATATAEEVGAKATPTPITDEEEAIAAVKARYPEVKEVERVPEDVIGAPTDITVIEREGGWDLVFRQGWEDCPAGCINNRYWYFSVDRDGTIIKVGEYSRIFDSQSNTFKTTGKPLWGVPE
ncbi:MAG: hypothetical protein ACE5NP_08215, partial [Anaerolineae bacterium]